MEKGFNSDLKIGSDFYHIQTEDWGLDSSIVVSRVFKNGAVLRSFKTPYGPLILNLNPLLKRQTIRDLLRRQHGRILDFLQNGQMFDEKLKLGE